MVTLTMAMRVSGCSLLLDDRRLRVDHSFDFVHRHVEAARDFAVGGFELARARSFDVEFSGTARAVSTERFELSGHRAATAINLEPAIKCGFKRIKRQGKTTGGRVDHALIGHRSDLKFSLSLSSLSFSNRPTHWTCR